MSQTITLNQDKSSHRFAINPEKAYFNIEFAQLSFPFNFDPNSGTFLIKYRLWRGKDYKEEHLGNISQFKKDKDKFILSGKLSDFRIDFEYKYLEIYVECDSDFEFLFKINKLDLRIKIAPVFERFDTHLSNVLNSKIFFSGSFGQGKTTFIHEYFKLHPEYIIFKVSPVNYSIATNEDVFKYIKAEILFQLLERGVVPGEDTKSYLETLPAYIGQNLHKIFSPFIKLLPITGNAWYSIYESLHEVIKGYSDYHKEKSKKSSNKIQEYITEVYEKDGGVFESDFYTRLITSLLQDYSGEDLKSVLIIDDLDRIDPDHIFRILNVFSAHFDNHIYSMEETPNKFGFNKIILVGDLHNIKKIYEYKYGPECKFDGYINKYYSTEPFLFDNRKALIQFITSLSFNGEDASLVNTLKFILADFAASDLLSIRELKCLLALDLGIILKGTNIKGVSNAENINNAYFVLIFTLLKVFDRIALLKKLMQMKNMKQCFVNPRFKEVALNFMNKYGLLCLIDVTKQQGKEQVIYLEKKGYSLTHFLNVSGNNAFNFHYIETIRDYPNDQPIQFGYNRFYEILEINLENYELNGGLWGSGVYI